MPRIDTEGEAHGVHAGVLRITCWTDLVSPAAIAG